MKVLIIPDVHGRSFWYKAEELINDVDHVIFLGDYLDPYPQEEISFEQALAEFEDIINFKNKHYDKVTLLYGNHDGHYTLGMYPSSRYNKLYARAAAEMYEKTDFKLAAVLENKYLFTHAGVTNDWLNKCNLTIEDLLKFPKIPVSLDVIGMQRGGFAKTGSCVWCDIYEFYSDLENTLNNIPYYQIFGHTWIQKEFITDYFACLDVQKCFILDTETNEIKSVTEETTKSIS